MTSQRLGETRVAIFNCPDTDQFSARSQKQKDRSPLAKHTTAFRHVLVMPVAGLAHDYGKGKTLSWPGRRRVLQFKASAAGAVLNLLYQREGALIDPLMVSSERQHT